MLFKDSTKVGVGWEGDGWEVKIYLNLPLPTLHGEAAAQHRTRVIPSLFCTPSREQGVRVLHGMKPTHQPDSLNQCPQPLAPCPRCPPIRAPKSRGPELGQRRERPGLVLISHLQGCSHPPLPLSLHCSKSPCKCLPCQGRQPGEEKQMGG